MGNLRLTSNVPVPVTDHPLKVLHVAMNLSLAPPLMVVHVSAVLSSMKSLGLVHKPILLKDLVHLVVLSFQEFNQVMSLVLITPTIQSFSCLMVIGHKLKSLRGFTISTYPFSNPMPLLPWL